MSEMRTLLAAAAALLLTSSCNRPTGDITLHPAASALRRSVVEGRTPGVQYLHLSADSILFRYNGGVSDVARAKPVERGTTFNGFSVTKTVTAVAVLQLVEAGAVDLDAPAGTYLTDFPYPGAITVRQLLAHASGIPNPIPLRWTHPASAHATFDRDRFFAEQFAGHARVKGAPDERSSYSNLGYHLLGRIIESAAGMSFERYATENILERIGVPAEELGFALDTTRHARGYHRRWSFSYPFLGLLMDRAATFEGREGAWQSFRPYYMNGPAYGGLIGTADGFARYLQALLDTASVLLTPASKALLFAEHMLRDGSRSGMTLSWFIGAIEGEPYFDHAGGGGGYYAELRIYPRLGRASVLLLNRSGFSNAHLLDEVDRHFVGIGRATLLHSVEGAL